MTTAITEAICERLHRVRRGRGVDLAERLLLIGRDCAAHLKGPFRIIDHEDLLYDDRGLPKWLSLDLPIIAILRDETEAPSHARTIVDATINFVESAVVIDASRDLIATRRFDDFIREAGISIEPVTKIQAQIAREAYRDFGKGSGHPAKLNFGDCFAYALAKESGEPLVFKGGDSARTDIVAV